MNLDADAYVEKAQNNGTFSSLILHTHDLDYNLKDFAALLRSKCNGGLVFLLNETADKYSYVAALGKAALDAGFSANDFVRQASALANGKGGGKPDLAQAGSGNAGNAEEILKSVKTKVEALS